MGAQEGSKGGEEAVREVRTIGGGEFEVEGFGMEGIVNGRVEIGEGVRLGVPMLAMGEGVGLALESKRGSPSVTMTRVVKYFSDPAACESR